MSARYQLIQVHPSGRRETHTSVDRIFDLRYHIDDADALRWDWFVRDRLRRKDMTADEVRTAVKNACAGR